MAPPVAKAPAAPASAAPILTSAPVSCTPGSRSLSSPTRATVVYVLAPTTARQAPRWRARSAMALARTNAYGLGQVLLAVSARIDGHCRPRWYRVLLPRRPNGTTGWIPARGLDVGAVRTRIVVDLSARRLVLYDDGRRVLETTAAIGAASTPTPTGRFFVDSRFRLTDATGPYGPAVLGMSAFSDAPQGWARGNPIGIHGTDEPASVGFAASHGCLRVPNAIAARLVRIVATGTPVEIRA